VPFLQPGDIVDDGGGSGFDAAVVAVNRPVLADCGVFETRFLLLGEEGLDILARAEP
jgi:hypothetical protein